jgi:HEAT repeat protein
MNEIPDIQKLIANHDILAMIEILNRKDLSHLHLTAIKALGNFGDSSAVEPLAPFLLLKKMIFDTGDENKPLRDAALDALISIGDTKAVKIIIQSANAKFIEQDQAVEALVGMGKKAVDALIPSLIKQAEIGLIVASKALGEIGDPKAVEPLIPVMNYSYSRFVRMTAVEALMQIGDIKAIEPIIASIEYTHKYNNNSTLDPILYDALGNFGGERAIGVLISELEKPGSEYAAKVLGRVKNPRAIEPLIVKLRKAGSFEYGYGQYYANALSAITDQKFWTDSDKWQQWWDAQNKT